MKVELNRIDNAFLFETSNDEGLTVITDGSPDIGGQGKGMRPMQLVLSAVASCSSIDIVLLLKKQRQDLHDIKVSVEGQRVDTEPRVFTDIHVHYHLYGNLEEKKVERACRLSMEKLCSVSLMLKAGGINITWEHSIHKVE
ncbi:putative redox protein [Lewinella marina]|uniref:Osmotically inducible protein OsmC n=1 Tax=Neolewinella marina TaxID=438751 RepID=A0A2G0CFQ5_9BACT|nr:OsmC family protein [Neolewinella marina]NJB85496.1 putative redox protein [Neolewinella marina]PHK98815.1 osmotically inducible protein OsmC [Neolewinella marina]